MPEDRIRLIGKIKSQPEVLSEKPFESTEFFWVKASENEIIEETESENLNKFIPLIETENQATIYFPFNSTTKELDDQVDDYLDQLALRIKQSGEKVLITGYTDDIGSSETNDKLGLRRAKKIRDILRAKGVNRSQIFTETKGESDPLVPNSSEQNRRKNRRTVVKVLE